MSLKDNVQEMQAAHDQQKAAIAIRLHGLNYWGKKLDSTRDSVINVIADEFDVDVECVKQVVAEETERKRTEKPKKKGPVKEDTRPVVAGSLNHTESQRATVAGKKFLVTSAQNNTHVHAEFLAALEFYAAQIGAQIIVFPFVYNKNAFQNGGEGHDDIWYDEAIKPYMLKESVWLGDTQKVAAMAYNILPTVKFPLTGIKEALGVAEAMIIPHATIAHENVAVLGAQFGAVVPGLYTTGAVTQRNYINMAAGNKAENRHNFGALIVEFNDMGAFWIRQIETDETGEFQDMRNSVAFGVNNGKCEWNIADTNISVINYGDIHAEKLDTNLADTLWNSNGGFGDNLLNYLKPRYQMMHDILDFSSLNHHNRDNPHHNTQVHLAGGTVEGDIKMVADVLAQVERSFCQTVVVRSNHDDALDRWLKDVKYDPRKDPANAKIYYRLQVAAINAYEGGQGFDALPIALRMLHEYNDVPLVNALFLKASESFKVGSVELGEHGHSGTNGSRGNPKQFAAQKMTTGHTHTSSIYGGCYTAGVTGKLAMGYNETGASSWVQSCVIQYPTGKRAIIHVKDNGTGGLDYMAR